MDSLGDTHVQILRAMLLLPQKNLPVTVTRTNCPNMRLTRSAGSISNEGLGPRKKFTIYFISIYLTNATKNRSNRGHFCRANVLKNVTETHSNISAHILYKYEAFPVSGGSSCRADMRPKRKRKEFPFQIWDELRSKIIGKSTSWECQHLVCMNEWRRANGAPLRKLLLTHARWLHLRCAFSNTQPELGEIIIKQENGGWLKDWGHRKLSWLFGQEVLGIPSLIPTKLGEKCILDVEDLISLPDQFLSKHRLY